MTDRGAEQVTIFAPGSGSNLGPGFDCLGVALAGRGDRVRMRRSDDPGVRIVSVSEPRIPLATQSNTAGLAATAVLKRSGRKGGLELDIEKGLPLAGGLGGSAASAVAAAVAADTLLGCDLSLLELLGIALDAESAVSGRHADNVGPSLLGGVVLIRGLDPLSIAPVRVYPGLAFVLASPEYRVETARARAVLPEQVARTAAVDQASHLAAFLLGLERGEHDLLRGSMVDHIAEPARAALYPGYDEARSAALEAGALGVAVSGAGPAVIALVPEASTDAVAAALRDGYARAGVAATAFAAAVDASGARPV